MRVRLCNGRGSSPVRHAILGLLAAFAAGGPALGDPLEDGLRLAAEGRCAEALPLLGAGERADAARARALCSLQLAEYEAAAMALAALEPASPELALELGIARFHAGDRAGAEEALQRAEARGDARAEVPLYLGLIALDREQAQSAAERFGRAQAVAGDALAPATTYYAGLARARSGERGAAREALGRVASDWPDTAWAEEAKHALAALDAARPLFAALRLGFEHDSNAVLRGEGVALPTEIPSQADQRFVWRGVVGRSWLASERSQYGGALAFSGSAHGELSRFDALQPSLTLWADRRIDEHTTLRGLAAYAHAWVDQRAFLSTPSFALELYRDFAERGATRFFAELALDDYRFASDPLDPDRDRRDRDGVGFRLGAEHRLSLPALRSSLTGGLAYRRFDADGTEYSFDSSELELGWESELPAQLVLGAGARYAYRPYRHGTTYSPPGRPERTEHDWRTELSLRRPIWRQLSLESRWRYQRNRSTADVFDYTRHVAGLYMNWTLNP